MANRIALDRDKLSDHDRRRPKIGEKYCLREGMPNCRKKDKNKSKNSAVLQKLV